MNDCFWWIIAWAVSFVATIIIGFAEDVHDDYWPHPDQFDSE